ncbi:MAG: peptide chain release factor N(5)-glutamine methyltransferase [Tannerellaceae bacterium]|nr:peptide chain release factor N(5)-glutamine methyltransferase [Tannerellaceae bacterium]
MTETLSFIRQSLSAWYPAEELTSLSRMVLSHVTGLSSYQLLSDKDKELSLTEKARLAEILERLKNYEPVQYILGSCEFYGLPFRVTPATLIPRPETEELVEWILQEQTGASPRILDIGTGSGCIAVALASQLKTAAVYALDISEEALQVAMENATVNEVEILFLQGSILDGEECKWLPGRYEIIVSNPPYVTEQEKGEMEANVLRYEPHTALFVKDEDPLLFYRAIARVGRTRLVPGGRLYVEINRRFGQEVTEMLREEGYKEVVVKKDLFGNDRMVKASI